jgi:uncharacterized oligopeptide transporter (OPT) family protein
MFQLLGFIIGFLVIAGVLVLLYREYEIRKEKKSRSDDIKIIEHDKEIWR